MAPRARLSVAGAHTCGLSRLTTARYYALLSLMHPDHVHAAVQPPKTLDARASASTASTDPHAIRVDSTAEHKALVGCASNSALFH